MAACWVELHWLWVREIPLSNLAFVSVRFNVRENRDSRQGLLWAIPTYSRRRCVLPARLKMGVGEQVPSV
jgi:hypothetical protein